ncbi:MAG: tetratricopeptide repeat protein [Bryobacteraceae bacterium]|jgi:Flp pilus assembly protein TadD
MPIENLTSDAQLNWPSRAAAAVVVYDLAGAKNIFARQVDSLSAAQSMQASHVLEGYFFERNGRIGIRATLEDLGKAKAVETFELDGATSAGFLPLVNELARRLSSDVRMFGTQNQKAFRFYGEALEAKDSQTVERDLEAATEADPGFTAGYVDEAKMLAETGNRQKARQVVQAGERARLDPIDRANLEYVGATAGGDATDRMKALESLTSATPANANIFTELGEMRFARREFKQAAMEYRAAAHLDPNALPIWNQLGYALAWAKDLSGAREALAQYQKLAPGDLNALDSQGEVSFFLGDFKSAAGYFEKAAARNPAELLKAAEARLMAGDLESADALFLKHLGPGAKLQKSAGYQMAQWEFLTGRRKAGLARMEKLTPELEGDLQSLGLSQLAIWKLEIGDSKAAAELANQAVMRAQSPQVRGIGGVCRYIASGTAGSGVSSGSKTADAYALLFAKKFGDALPLLQSIYSETNPSADGQVRTLLAWAYVETGAMDKAAKLLDTYPLPLSSGEPLFASLMFPRYLFLRGAVLQHEGKRDEANKSYGLYSKYGGQEQFSATK